MDDTKCRLLMNESLMGHNNRLQIVLWLPALFVSRLVLLLFGLHRVRKIASAADFLVFLGVDLNARQVGGVPAQGESRSVFANGDRAWSYLE